MKPISLHLELSKQLPVEIVKHKVNMNLGPTIRDGLTHALSRADSDDIIITMDADYTHKPHIALDMIMKIKSGHDIIVASRYERGGAEIGLKYYRSLLSKGINLILKILFPINNIKDYTCGYRAYSAKLLFESFDYYKGELVTERGFTCMVEIILKLRPLIKGASEVPLILRYDLKYGQSKMNVTRTILAYFSLIIRELKAARVDIIY